MNLEEEDAPLQGQSASTSWGRREGDSMTPAPQPFDNSSFLRHVGSMFNGDGVATLFPGRQALPGREQGRLEDCIEETALVPAARGKRAISPQPAIVPAGPPGTGC